MVPKQEDEYEERIRFICNSYRESEYGENIEDYVLNNFIFENSRNETK